MCLCYIHCTKIYSKVAICDHQYLLEFSRILQHSVQALCNFWDGFLWIGNGWKLLLTVLTSSFIWNVAGHLDPTLKHIDKIRLRQLSISSCICMFKLSKSTRNLSNIFQVYNKDTSTTPSASVVNYEHISHVVLLLLLVNSTK